jgi:hypothetical protein
VTTDPYPDLPGAEPPGAASRAPDDVLELDEADSRLLAALSRPAPPVVTAAEDQPRTASAEDAGVPVRLAHGPRVPVFQEPS